MYQIGEYVVYGIHGVCRILGTEKQLVDRKRAEFLVLEPIAQLGSRFYLPVQNPTALAKLKSVLTEQELEQLLNSACYPNACWVPEENRRKTTYREILNSADRSNILLMLTAVYHYRDEQAAQGKKFHLCDDNFLRDAEKFLSSEISHVKGLPMQQAREYLRSRLQP